MRVSLDYINEKQKWVRFLEWTRLRGVFRGFDLTRPDSFYAHSDFVGSPNCYALAPRSRDGELEFVIYQGHKPDASPVLVAGSDIAWIVDCFVGPTYAEGLAADLIEVDRILGLQQAGNRG